MVPELSSQHGEVHPAAGIHHHHGIPAGGRSGRDRQPVEAGIQNTRRAPPDELFYVSPMSNPENQLDLAAVRSRLQGVTGREYWRSLDDLASTPEFYDLVNREFPRQALGWSEDENPVEGRRNFLKLM